MQFVTKNRIDLRKIINDKIPRIFFPKLVQCENETQFHELLDELIEFLKNKGKLQLFSEILKQHVLPEIDPQYKQQVENYFQSYHYKHPDLLILKDFVKVEFFVPLFTPENRSQF